MTLWRLEWLRLTRTGRWAVLAGVYAFFGVLGPFSARYLQQILERFGGSELAGVQLPDPAPADGIIQFTGNASQLGLLAVVIVAAGALSIDANPQVSAFLRTRVERASRLVWPRYVVVALAAALALTVGTALAVALTAILIGAVPLGLIAVGTLYGAVYLGFAVAVVAAAASLTRSVLSTVLLALGVLIALPVLALFPPVEPWVPSELVSAVDLLVADRADAGDFWRATLMAAVAGAGLLTWAGRRTERREV